MPILFLLGFFFLILKASETAPVKEWIHTTEKKIQENPRFKKDYLILSPEEKIELFQTIHRKTQDPPPHLHGSEVEIFDYFLKK